jgi:hypothetical protein
VQSLGKRADDEFFSAIYKLHDLAQVAEPSSIFPLSEMGMMKASTAQAAVASDQRRAQSTWASAWCRVKCLIKASGC